jgi:cytidylate kinase
MTDRVIAIDGPAGSGKSTTAATVAERLGFAHLDSGALYRAVTLGVLDAQIPDSGSAIVGLVRSLPVRLSLVGEAFRPEVAGVDVSQAIRSPRVNARVSAIASIPAVREWVNEELRTAAAQHPYGVVADGRDIGTVVFPGARVKIFLTASPEERAKRRARQSGSDLDARSLERVQTELHRRDTADSTRQVAPLIPAEDAILLDTTTMSFEDQVQSIVALAPKAFGPHTGTTPRA